MAARAWAGLLCAWAALSGLACVEPRSGLHAADWCRNDEAGSDLIDDMEDGDGAICSKRGAWSVTGPATTVPGPGGLSTSADLPADDVIARATAISYRGQHLGGTLEAGATAALVVSLGSIDLRLYDQVLFWARADSGNAIVRVSVATPETTEVAEGGTCDPGASACGELFGDDAMIAETWGDPTAEGANNIALAALTQEKTGRMVDVDNDLAGAIALQFRFTGTGGRFGFWIDDLRLKKKTGP
jgi:hypothetical protein